MSYVPPRHICLELQTVSLFAIRDFANVIKVRISGLNPKLSLYKAKDESRMQTHRRNVHLIVEAKTYVIHPQAEISRLPAPEAGRGKQGSPSRSLWRESSPSDALIDPSFTRERQFLKLL